MIASRNGQLTEEYTSRPVTAGYRPSARHLPHWLGGVGLGGARFDLSAVEFMMEEPTVALGITYVEAPIATADGLWRVVCDDERVKTKVEHTLKRFWQKSLFTALTCIRYGYSGSEATYFTDAKNELCFDELMPLHPRDIVALTTPEGKFGGIRVKSGHLSAAKVPDLMAANTMVRDGVTYRVAGRPCKGFWLTHGQPESFHRLYGRSRLTSAWKAWRQKVSQDGAEEMLAMWYYKNSFTGVRIWHPDEDLRTAEGGVIPARMYAQQIGEWIKTGATVAMPLTFDRRTGQPKWKIEDPHFNGNPEGLLDYIRFLKGEILQGILIPDNVLTEAAGGGSYGGRKVPEDAFYVAEERIFQEVVTNLDDQIIKPLIQFNYGVEHAPYEIQLLPLVPIRQQEAMQELMAQGQGAKGIMGGRPKENPLEAPGQGEGMPGMSPAPEHPSQQMDGQLARMSLGEEMRLRVVRDLDDRFDDLVSELEDSGYLLTELAA